VNQHVTIQLDVQQDIYECVKKSVTWRQVFVFA